MRVLSDLVMKGSVIVLDSQQDFPTNPSIGQFCFTDAGILYIYATIGQVTTWWPLTDKINYYVHSQGVSAETWVVEHNLESNDLVFMVYDNYDNIQLVSNAVFNDINTVSLEFTESMKGKVIVFSASGPGGAPGSGGSTSGVSEFNPWLVKSSAYAAVIFDRVMADTSAGSWIFTLPSTDVMGDTVVIVDIAGSWLINNLIVESQDDALINGIVGPMNLNINRVQVTFIYSGSTYGWITC